MPKHLLGGNIRLSTVLVTLVFTVTLVTYLLVRPVPASGTDPPAPPGHAGQRSITPDQTPTPTGPTPTMTPRPSRPTVPPAPSGTQIATSPPPTS